MTLQTCAKTSILGVVLNTANLQLGASDVENSSQSGVRQEYLLDNIFIIKEKVKLKALIGHSRKPSVLRISKQSNIKKLDTATKKLSDKLKQQNIEIIRIHKI